MPEEIERKFLVKKTPSDLKNYHFEKIYQGYIAAAENIEIRIRKKGARFFQTVKGSGDIKRKEVEIELSEKQFEELWPLTEGKRIEKVRYEIPSGDNLIELDIYSGLLNGLVTAEVEFDTDDQSQKFIPPSWFENEVTNDQRYKNKNLSLKGLPEKNKK